MANNILYKLKQKWKLKNTWQVVAILLTFTLAGSSVIFFREFLFQMLGFRPTTSIWTKVAAYLLLVFPIYQALLLLFGYILGQFSFFWEKEKKLYFIIRNKF